MWDLLKIPLLSIGAPREVLLGKTKIVSHKLLCFFFFFCWDVFLSCWKYMSAERIKCQTKLYEKYLPAVEKGYQNKTERFVQNARLELGWNVTYDASLASNLFDVWSPKSSNLIPFQPFLRRCVKTHIHNCNSQDANQY